MPVVTSLRATRGGRVAVHLDGAYACTVSASLVAALRLYRGRELTDDDARQLLGDAGLESALADAYRLLSHRSRSTDELRQRLTAKGRSEDVVDAVLARLAAEKLLDDAAFARAFAADRMRLAAWGRARILRELAGLGVAADLAEAAVAAVSAEGEGERARAALAKRRPTQPLDAAKRRAYQLLLRRGFDPHVAYDAVQAWAAGGGADTEEPPSDSS